MGEQRKDESWCMAAGMISSGKSRFLNSIFRRLHLPVGSIPLTAAPTYIRYGEAAARITLEGNRTVESRPEELALYDRRWAKKESKILNVEVYLEEELLKEQMVFVDTPGIGDVEGEADRIFYQLLPQVQVVFYFLEKAMSQGDKQYLDEICRQGAKLIIVRTKIDNIYSSEERVDEVLREEGEKIRSLYPECELYFISMDSPLAENQLEQLKDDMARLLPEAAAKVKRDRQRLCRLEELEARRGRLTEELEKAGTREVQVESLEKDKRRRSRELDDGLRWARADVEKAADMAKRNCRSQMPARGAGEPFKEQEPGEAEIRRIERALSDLSVWYQEYLGRLTERYLSGAETEDLKLLMPKVMPPADQRQLYDKPAREYFARAKEELLTHFQKVSKGFQREFEAKTDAEERLIRLVLQMDRQITRERLTEELAGIEKQLEAVRSEAHG